MMRHIVVSRARSAGFRSSSFSISLPSTLRAGGALYRHSSRSLFGYNVGSIFTKQHRIAIPEEDLPEVFKEEPAEVQDYIAPERTTFEVLEDAWDWLLGFLAPIQKQQDLMNAVVGGTGLSWGSVFVLWGILIRALTLIPNLYVNRNGLRMARIQTQLSLLNDRLNKAKGDRKMSSPEKKIIQESIKRQKKQLFKQHKCSQARTAAQIIMLPVMGSAFMAIRNLVYYDSTLETANFLWIKDLTMPDPYFLLPALCLILFYINFEMNQKLAKGGRGSMGMYVRWGIRAGSIGVAYMAYQQPAAIFCYWLGLSFCGLLQPLLLRWQPFRDFFDFPDISESVKKADWLTRLLNGKTQDDIVAEAAKTKFKTVKDFKIIFDDDTKIAKEPLTAKNK